MYLFTPTNPWLLTRSPSPTTIEYTVTTAPIPPASALSRYVLLLWEVFARVSIMGVWLVLGAVKYSDEMLACGRWGVAGGADRGAGGGGDGGVGVCLGGWVGEAI